MYIKNGITNTGYKLEKADGSIVLNAPKEMWEAEGWSEFVEKEYADEQPEPGKSVVDLKEEIIEECKNFYNNVVLEVSFQKSLTWIPLEKRISYIYILNQLKSKEETVNFEGIQLSIEKAISYLEQMNEYAFKCNNVYSNHLKMIAAFKSVEELEMYDYTVGYPDMLKFE